MQRLRHCLALVSKAKGDPPHGRTWKRLRNSSLSRNTPAATNRTGNGELDDTGPTLDASYEELPKRHPRQWVEGDALSGRGHAS